MTKKERIEKLELEVETLQYHVGELMKRVAELEAQRQPWGVPYPHPDTVPIPSYPMNPPAPYPLTPYWYVYSPITTATATNWK